MKFSWVNEDYPSICPVYFDFSYLRLFAKHSQSQLKILRIESSQDIAWLPLELRQIGQEFWEASSAYGYGGLWSTHLTPICTNVWKKLMEFLASERIVCVFLRHAPFLHNHLFWPIEKRKLNRKTYACALHAEATIEQFCENSDQKLRSSIHTALRQNLIVEFHNGPEWSEHDVKTFYGIYRQLMQDKRTDTFYEFSEQFFVDHAHAFGTHSTLGLVRTPDTKQIVAGAIFLQDSTQHDQWVHYHLSASERHNHATQSVELLLAQACVYFGHRGFQHLHLGGGHALDESDGLSKFKKKFATATLDFEISTWICDEQAYQSERDRLPLQNPSLFLIRDARGAL